MEISRLLIVRTSALGDVVHSLPVLTALRRHLPQTTIGWVVEEAMAPLLRGHPDLDQIIPVRLRSWRHRPLAAETLGQVGRFLRQLRQFSPEVVLDLMGNHKAGILSALSDADRRIGLERPFRREPSSAIWINDPFPAAGEHAVDRSLGLLQALDIPTEEPDFGGAKLFPEEPAEIAALRQLQGERPWVLIHPGAAWPNKCYPPELWGQVGAAISSTADVDVYVTSNEAEETLARRTVEASSEIVKLAPAPTLAHLAALLRSATLVLGGDTGPVHLAHALGTGVLCLMGPTDFRRSGPYGAPERVLSADLSCRPCHQRLKEIKPCLSEIPPETVIRRALDLLI